MLFSNMVNAYHGDKQISRMYKAGEIIYEKDLLPILFETNFIQATNWSIQYDPGRAYLAEVITEPTITKPAIISGHTMTSWGVNANIAWPDAKLALMENDGNIDFYWEPEYTGAPSQDVTLFETSSPKIAVTHNSDGTLEAKFYDFGGSLIKSISAPYGNTLETILTGNVTIPENVSEEYIGVSDAGFDLTVLGSLIDTSSLQPAKKIRIRIFFTFDDTSNNELTIKIDDTILVTELAFGDIDRGDVTNCAITDFMACAIDNEGSRGSRLRIHTNF